jgi:tetratricopeptide (TPR) repeat protein
LDQQLDSIAQPFYKGDYDKAVLNAEKALNVNPDNSILLFAYSQSLFATGQYDRSATAVRDALTLVNGKKQDMFYAGSFYGMQGVLNAQINNLEKTTQQQQANPNLQLLLGYQLWGVGRFDEAAAALQSIQKDPVNGLSATFLRGIVEHAQQLVNQNAPEKGQIEMNIQK